jgi:hypothetical protein
MFVKSNGHMRMLTVEWPLNVMLEMTPQISDTCAVLFATYMKQFWTSKVIINPSLIRSKVILFQSVALIQSRSPTGAATGRLHA